MADWKRCHPGDRPYSHRFEPASVDRHLGDRPAQSAWPRRFRDGHESRNHGARLAI